MKNPHYFIAGMLLTAMTCFSQQDLVLNNTFLVLNGGTKSAPIYMELNNSSSSAIKPLGTGGIISESEFNMVKWDIGTHTGNYSIPFNYNIFYPIPLTFNLTGAGTGSGSILFSTYHCAIWDNAAYEPSGVINMMDFGSPDFSKGIVDRFWIMDASSYSTKPIANTTFTYLRSGVSEIAIPNYILEWSLIAQRFNSSSNTWGDFLGMTGTDMTNANTGTVSSGSVSAVNFFRSWALSNDSNLITGVLPVTASEGLIIFPNPTTQTLNLKFSGGQSGNAVISIVDIIGREIMRQSQYVSEGMILPVDISTLPAAMYFIKVNSDNFNATAKFIKQ